MHVWLLQAQTPGGQAADVLVAVFWLTLAAVVISIAFFLLRKWFLREESGEPAAGFSMADLRRMRDAGELTEEQFAAARASLIAHGRAMLGPESDAASEDTAHVASDGEFDGDGLSDESLNADRDSSSDKNGGSGDDGGAPEKPR